MKFKNEMMGGSLEEQNIISSLESLSMNGQELNELQNRLDEQIQVINDCSIAKEAIGEYGVTAAVVASLNGLSNAFTSSMESFGIDISPEKYGTAELQDTVLNKLDASIEAATEGFLDTIKEFFKKLLDWILGLFSSNRRMLNLFKKAQVSYDASIIDEKYFETIVLHNGLELKDFGALGAVIVKFDKMCEPFLFKFCGYVSMINLKDLLNSINGDADAQKKLDMAINTVVALGKAFEGITNPKGLVTVDVDETGISNLKFDFNVIGKVDKTTKELGFNPKVLDACIDNSADVLGSVNSYSNALSNNSKKMSKFFDNIKQNDFNPQNRRMFTEISNGFRKFSQGCQFINTGSQIMSRMVYTMLKQAKIKEGANLKGMKDVTNPPTTFGQYLLTTAG